MSKEMNLESIKFSHDNWFAKIAYYLDGHLTPKHEIVILHSECKLEKWFYKEGKEIFGNKPRKASQNFWKYLRSK